MKRFRTSTCKLRKPELEFGALLNVETGCWGKLGILLTVGAFFYPPLKEDVAIDGADVVVFSASHANVMHEVQCLLGACTSTPWDRSN